MSTARSLMDLITKCAKNLGCSNEDLLLDLIQYRVDDNPDLYGRIKGDLEDLIKGDEIDEDHPDGPMAEHSHDLTKQQLETLESPARLVIEEGEDWALDPSDLLALDIDVTRQDCPVVLRIHPTLQALLDTLHG